MFYVEVHLQTEGKVRDVKVELAGDQHKPRGQVSKNFISKCNLLIHLFV